MSVLIKMAMPENCYECRFVKYVWHNGEERWLCIAHLNEITNLKERLETCPLEEVEEPKHGTWIYPTGNLITGQRLQFQGSKSQNTIS